MKNLSTGFRNGPENQIQSRLTIRKLALVMSSIIMSGFFSVGITWKNFSFGSFAIRWTAWLTDSMGLQQWKQQNRRSWGHKTAGTSSKIFSPAEIKINWRKIEKCFTFEFFGGINTVTFFVNGFTNFKSLKRILISPLMDNLFYYN